MTSSFGIFTDGHQETLPNSAEAVANLKSEIVYFLLGILIKISSILLNLDILSR
jgi:hypothetical protein